MMVNISKEKAISLRRDGKSVKEISKFLGISQGTVSFWVRKVPITIEQKTELRKRAFTRESIEKRRQSRLASENTKRSLQITAAANSVGEIDRNSLLLIGAALYWAEGGKTNLGMAKITNSDPDLIRVCMKFFQDICMVPNHRLRGHIHIHSKDAVGTALSYWSEVTQMPLSQFYKSYTVPSKSSKHKRKSLPYGTLEISVCDIKQHLKILGWIEGIKKQLK